jgi:hypothetical protein
MPGRIYKTKWFARFARKEGVRDRSLREAIDRAERGIVDADLGGYRMLVAYREQGRAVFLFGFAKNERENIDPDELTSLQEIAAAWLMADQKRIETAIETKELQAVSDGEEES